MVDTIDAFAGLTDSICACGAGAGFQHKRFCPFPLFDTDHDNRWLYEHSRIKRDYYQGLMDRLDTENTRHQNKG